MTTDPIRNSVVEAMAQAFYQAATGLDDWDDEDEYEPESAAKTRDLAEAALDAALGVLGEQRDSWLKAASTYTVVYTWQREPTDREMDETRPWTEVPALLAVLRGGKGSE